MSTEESKTLNRRVFEALSRRDVKGASEQCAPDCKFHGFAPQTLDLEGYQHFLTMNFAAFPDTEFTIEDVIAEGDRVATRYTNRGTHQGL
jgi:predicted ester cyclase